MKVYIIFCVSALVTPAIVYSAMTEAQIQAAGKLLRNVCQPKFKPTNEQIEKMHQGVFEDDRKLMCYMQCCLQMGRLMKNEKFDLDSSLKQVGNLPEARREPTSRTINACKDAAKSEDKCEAGYELAKCIYFDNPDNYFLP